MNILRKLSLEVRLLLVLLPPIVGMMYFAIQLNGQPSIETNWPLISAIVLVVATAALAYLVLASLIRQLSAMHSTFTRLNEGRDLTARVKIEGSDATGIPATAVNQVLDSLTSSLDQYEESSSTILESTQSLCTASGRSNHNLQLQQEQMGQFANSISELVSMINDVAENSRVAADATEQARGQTQHGALVATNAMCAIEAVFDDLDSADGTIDVLNERSRDVGQILEVIGSISEQTNLLALNAAIEAARAGEHGRGFAVVADEVRNLASKTQDSISEIQQIIDQLQSGAKQAVKRMGEARAKAHDGVQQVEDSAESLGTIAGEVATLVEMNSRIAEATDQQNSLANTLVRGIDEIQNFAKENRGDAEAQLKIAEELHALVGGIQKVATR